jgi:hypothetical protein
MPHPARHSTSHFDVWSGIASLADFLLQSAISFVRFLNRIGAAIRQMPKIRNEQSRRDADLATAAPPFEADPAVRAWRIAQMFIRDRSPDELAAMTSEIKLELAQPTQQVRDILGNPASEERCRQFLASFLSSITAAGRKS